VDGRTNVRTYVHTNGHLRPALLGRLCRRFDLKRLRKTDYTIHIETILPSVMKKQILNEYPDHTKIYTTKLLKGEIHQQQSYGAKKMTSKADTR